MKRLIVNADDLGADAARNEGIFEAIRAGVVTSASVLANGPALEHAMEGIRSIDRERVSFGVHLNLTEGRPLYTGSSCLTGPDGCFLGKTAGHRLLMKPGDASLLSDVAREVMLQMGRLLDDGLGVTHVDGHQHVHVFPAVLRVVAEAAGSRGIRCMRIPDESVPLRDETLPAELLDEARRFSALGAAARECLDGSEILAPDHFRGLLLKGRLSLETLLSVVGQLPEGLTELMVHPGRVPVTAPFSAFSSPDRARELESLLDPRFRQALDRAGIVLVSFREVSR